MSNEPVVPNPGSDEAIEMGCKCPPMDNGYGRGRQFIGGEVLFVMTDDCPLHYGKKAKEVTKWRTCRE